MATNLTFKFVENLKAPGRYTDALVKGLHLWVKVNLKQYWIFRFSSNGKQHNISLGAYPKVSIAEARIKAQKARDELDKGSNPLTQRNEAKLKNKAKTPQGAKTFREFSLECLQKKRLEWTNTKHADQWLYTLEEFAFPVIGSLPVNQVTMEHILTILSPIWATKTETASRLRGRMEWILAAATALRLREGSNPASWRGHLQTILPAPKKIAKVKHFRALPYDQIPELLTKLNDLCSIGALALEFTILNASRSGEVFGGLQSEVNGDIWTIPATRMKAKKEHRIPLCSRSLEILSISRAMDPESNYLFSRKGKPLSGMTMAMVLRRLEVDATVHGFRSGFRDWASEETNHPSEVIEMALAHAITNRVEAAYRRRDLLEKRRALLLEWERHCLDRPLNNIVELKVA